MQEKRYSVHAGNVGNVRNTDDRQEAIKTADDYANGRCGGRCDGSAYVLDNFAKGDALVHEVDLREHEED
jgi:hypothetical protein